MAPHFRVGWGRCVLFWSKNHLCINWSVQRTLFISAFNTEIFKSSDKKSLTNFLTGLYKQLEGSPCIDKSSNIHLQHLWLHPLPWWWWEVGWQRSWRWPLLLWIWWWAFSTGFTIGWIWVNFVSLQFWWICLVMSWSSQRCQGKVWPSSITALGVFKLGFWWKGWLYDSQRC